MKTFVLTNDSIPGEIYIHEDDCGKLRFDFTKSDASAAQQSFLLRIGEQGFADLQKALTGNSQLMALSVTFDMFWTRYDDKVNSSRKRAQLKWDKMPTIERQKAFNFIPGYFTNIPYGTRKKFAETYLNAELWNN